MKTFQEGKVFTLRELGRMKIMIYQEAWKKCGLNSLHTKHQRLKFNRMKRALLDETFIEIRRSVIL
jgi:hypothetical protein